MKISKLLVFTTLCFGLRSPGALIVSYNLDGPGTDVVQSGFTSPPGSETGI
ncbi:hypothetical protein P0Y35_11615 [Kiritimatiellaeota bacterium B1221]|nr:hypothetical protein [Kiritimatiellaeota bacterium B1221]